MKVMVVSYKDRQTDRQTGRQKVLPALWLKHSVMEEEEEEESVEKKYISGAMND